MNKKKETDIKTSTLLLFGFILVFRYSVKKLVRWSKYIPFPLVSRHSLLHYKNNDINEAWDIIFDEARGCYFKVKSYDIDQYFVHLYGKPKIIKKGTSMDGFIKRLVKRLGDVNVFVTQMDTTMYKISIARRALPQE